MSRLPIPHFIERLFAEKADKPVIVTVTVDTAGASMSATDLAKLTSDMVMCSYTGDRTKLKTDLSILPGSGQQPTGEATSQTTFTVAFIHSANTNSVASVIPYDITIIDKGITLTTQAETMIYTGLSVTIPANSIFLLAGIPEYNSSPPMESAFGTNSDPGTLGYLGAAFSAGKNVIVQYAGYTPQALTLYLFAKWQTSSNNNTHIRGWYKKLN